MAYTDWLQSGDRRSAAVERIVEAAADQIAHRGFDRLDVDAVARDAGCSRATVYRHVGGKSALIDAVLVRGIARIGSQIERAVEAEAPHRRAVTAILASLEATRADPIAVPMLRKLSPAAASEYLAQSPRITGTAAALTGVNGDQSLAAQWISRVVMSFLLWPAPDPATEAQMIERFVYPVLADDTAARTSADASSDSAISPARTATFESSEDDKP